jgi:nucleotide-binding universal stress UspA family protein
VHILLCVEQDDILDELLVAFRWGVRVGPSDRVSVLHVSPKLPWLRAIGRVDPTIGEQVATLPKRTDALLSDAVSFLTKEGIRAESLRREGSPAEQILQAAGDERADLLVLGALGREDKENFLLGSVSQKVKQHADRDVFIVRRGGPSARARFNAVLAVDGSRESLAAVRSFATKMHVVLADIHVLHVVEQPEPADSVGVEDARAILAKEGLTCSVESRRGRAASEILACARERNARVIAVGARGLGAISSAFLGSVSARVLRHAPCAVLCARCSE